MARGGTVTSPPSGSSLPKVEFEVIDDDKLKLPGGVHDLQARSFGFNDFADFRRPDHYIRHIEPLESDLAKTVEYDMDEQDQEWLDAVNSDRGKHQMDKVTCESFEIIMDRLEKEWFDLTKNIPKPDFAMPSEDSTCAICDDSEGENSNAIVFCDGCNLAVHQDCYGVPYIPEGQWLCRKCTVSPEVPVNCHLCPNEGGAFKQTVTGEWVHLLCAIWIPETRVANDVFMEPVTGVERISKQRWKLRCSICQHRYGACIQCTKPSCFVAFHATCARKEKLLMPMKSAQGAEPASLTCFCDRHLPPEQQDARAAALVLDNSHERSGANTQVGSKSARAYAKTYKPGPPLVPDIIVRRILKYIGRIRIRKKVEFIQQVARYWSLKREVRRGAPLLKRLHLEPWTANASAKPLTDEEKFMRIDQLQRLRKDLMDIQRLNDLCRKREVRKLRQNEVIYEVLSQGLFPHYSALRLALERIMSLDRQDHFKNPVSKHDVPDYFDVIKKPMCWSDIDSKLEQHKYWDLQSFRDDIQLVIDNALTYNKPGTIFHKTATRIQREAKVVLADLEYLKVHHDDVIMKNTGPTASDSLPPIGDLEPPLNVLQLLLSAGAIKEDLNLELEVDPVTSLINYELAKVKPPPPNDPSPVASPPMQRLRHPTTPKKRNRVKETMFKPELVIAQESGVVPQPSDEVAHSSDIVQPIDVAIQPNDIVAQPSDDIAQPSVVEIHVMEDQEDGERDAEHESIHESEEHDEAELPKQRDRELQAQLDASAGFHAPRTRGALAAAAAFEAEVCGLAPVQESAGPSQLEGEPVEIPHTPVYSSKKRHTTAPVSQTSIPRVVHDVGNRDSFSMFNAGWILPPDQKRGGRAPADRQALPPPKKRQKTDHSSRLSIVSTAPSDNYTLRRTPPWSSDAPEAKHNPNESMDQPMDVDGDGDLSFDSRHIDHGNTSYAGDESFDINEPLNVVTQPNGVVIIEKLDTPAIRREKNIRRKAEKQRQAARAAEEGASAISAGSSNHSILIKKSSPPPPIIPPASPPPPPPPPPLPYVEEQYHEKNRTDDNATMTFEDNAFNFEEESELSELSSSSVSRSSPFVPEEPPVRPATPEPSTSRAVTKKVTRPKPKKSKKKEAFPEGTIVWAKSDSFPWWPAVVHADSNPMVPKNILAAAKEKRQKRKIKLYIVQYYDKQKSWQSIAKDKLQELGEDKKLDEEMLSSNQKQKWKTSASKQQCREAYRLALAEMDTENSSAHLTDLSFAGDDADGESES